jgi:hypothetical protein
LRKNTIIKGGHTITQTDTQISEIRSTSDVWNKIQAELENDDIALVSITPEQDKYTSVRIEYGELTGQRNGSLKFTVEQPEYEDLIENIGANIEDYETKLFYTPIDNPYDTEIY